jgi:hypothetical protein
LGQGSSSRAYGAGRRYDGGLAALETLVYFDRGDMLKGLSAAVLVGFVVGSIAFRLAAARFISQPEWLRE